MDKSIEQHIEPTLYNLDGISFREVEASRDFGLVEPISEASGYNPNSIPGFKQTVKYTPKYSAKQINKKKKGTIAKFFSNLSRLGMDYEDQVISNMRAIPADKNLLPKDSQRAAQDLFGQMMSAWKVKDNKDKGFFEKDFQNKRETLRGLACQPELEDILDTMCNESIVYDSNYVYFAEPFIDDNDLIDFEKGTADKINKSVTESFRKFYTMLEWRTRAWDDFKRFLIEGILAWEIVYDSLEKPTRIIGLIPLDPATLTKTFNNGKWYWIQFKGINGKERKLLDAQIIYIQFQETQSISRLSYLERLIRPYNIYRIIEQAQIVWTVTNASYKTKFTIPVKGMGKVLGSQTLNSAMNRYREDIQFISDTGELTINGKAQMPFNKEYWMPESEAGSPEIETLGGDGPELMDSDYLKFFKNQLYKISKIPLNRFDQDAGETWFGTDAESYARTEIDFARYVNRLRNIFAQIILKPIQMQLCLDLPEIQDNKSFLSTIQLHYKSYNLFEELMEIELMTKRVEHIQNMKDSLVDMDAEGNEVKFFSSKFLVQKYLHLSDQDIKLNEKYKQEEMDELNLAGGENEDDFEVLKQGLADLKVVVEKKLDTNK